MQSRGNKFLNHSKCGYCKKSNKAVKPYGHMLDKGYLSLKGSFVYVVIMQRVYLILKPNEMLKAQGIKSFFKGVYNKVIKPLGREAMVKI